jgi:hypothetical protein
VPKAIGDWSPVNFGGSRILELNFTDSLGVGDTVASLAGWSCVIASGDGDATPANRILTPPTLTGSKTQQKFISLGSGILTPIVYICRADVVTTFGEDLELWSYLACVPVGWCGAVPGCA